jgi:hypothetical protein
MLFINQITVVLLLSFHAFFCSSSIHSNQRFRACRCHQNHHPHHPQGRVTVHPLHPRHYQLNHPTWLHHHPKLRIDHVCRKRTLCVGCVFPPSLMTYCCRVAYAIVANRTQLRSVIESSITLVARLPSTLYPLILAYLRRPIWLLFGFVDANIRNYPISRHISMAAFGEIDVLFDAKKSAAETSAVNSIISDATSAGIDMTSLGEPVGWRQLRCIKDRGVSCMGMVHTNTGIRILSAGSSSWSEPYFDVVHLDIPYNDITLWLTSDNTDTRTINVYDFKAYSQNVRMHEAHHHGTCVTWHNCLVVIGGATGSSKLPTTRVEYYDPIQSDLRTFVPMPPTLSLHQQAAACTWKSQSFDLFHAPSNPNVISHSY